MCMAVHVTEYDKSPIFQLLPDVFNWYYSVINNNNSVIHNKLTTTTSTTHIGLLSQGFPFAR